VKFAYYLCSPLVLSISHKAFLGDEVTLLSSVLFSILPRTQTHTQLVKVFAGLQIYNNNNATPAIPRKVDGVICGRGEKC